MKKFFLPLILLSINAFSQLQPGYYPNKGYAYEDFGSASEYSSLHWTNTGPKPYISDSLNFISKICYYVPGSHNFRVERSPVAKKGNMLISQPYASYEQIFLEFGKDVSGRQKTLDLSKDNAYLSYKIKNNSTEHLKIWFYVYDSTGSKINCVGTNILPDSYLDFTENILLPNESVSDTINFNENGYEARFSIENCKAGFFTDQVFTFNKSIVSKIGITILNNRANQWDSYKSFKMDNAAVEFSDIKIGAVTIINSIDELQAKGETSIFPNPSKNTVHFSHPLHNIILTDLSGNVIMKAGTASELDISEFPAGTFLLHSSSLTKPTKIVKQ